MKNFTDLQEGLYDPNIFKAFFLAGGPGSGKSYVVKKSTGGTGMKIVNSDDVFEKYLKQAKLDFKMQASQKSERDALRTRAKKVTEKRKDNYVEGRLGLIIDGTGKDFGKISSQAAGLKQIGYDVHMIFVNTSLEVALENNKNRKRVVPEKEAMNMWKQVQANIGKFQQFFGPKNFIIVDNDMPDLDGRLFDHVFLKVKSLLRKKVDNFIAKAWMAKELRLKQR
jgi:cytidylate kinase